MFLDYLQKLSAIRHYDKLATMKDRLRTNRRTEAAAAAARPEGLAETARLREELEQEFGRPAVPPDVL